MIRITVRCEKDRNHAKVLNLKSDQDMQWAFTLAELLEGTSAMYHFPPGDQSPIGRCAVCGGKVKCEIGEVRILG